MGFLDTIGLKSLWEKISERTTKTLPAGMIWTQSNTPAVSDLCQPVYANGIWVTCGGSSAAWSEDGKTWTVTAMPSYSNWCQPIYANGIWVTCSNGLTARDSAAWSTDGKTWMASSLPASAYWRLPVYANGIWVTCASGSTGDLAAWSEDGKTWTASTMPVKSDWWDPVYGNGVWVTCNGTSNSGNTAAYSTDGKTWTKTTLPSSAYWTQPVYANGIWVICNGYVNKTTAAAYSIDGKTWTAITMPLSEIWNQPVYANGVWVTCCVVGTTAAWSTDGKTWTASTLPASASWNQPAYANGKWVLFGGYFSEESNVVLWSSNGKNWYNDYKLPSIQRWKTPVYNNGFWVNLSGNGSSSIALSKNGYKWWNVSLPSTAYWTQPVYANGIWVTCSNKGFLYSEPTKHSYVGIRGNGRNAEVFNDCENNIASGAYSHAQGTKTIAAGEDSHAEGYFSEANGEDSHAEGYSTRAEGECSHAGGYKTVANAYQTAIGRYNVEVAGPTSASDTSGDLFIVGIGTSSSNRKTGLRMNATGKTYGAQSFSGSGADYAEYFEWEDGNPDGEDRRGMIVALNEKKIRPATSEDYYVAGIVSAFPAIEGDSASEEWHQRHLKDIFGAPITEKVEVPETIDEETGEIIPAHTETRWVFNPDYDPNEPYIKREDRKEWSPIGIVGKLVVTDDGSCKVNSYCKPGENGIGTHTDDFTWFRVMERLDDTHVRVLIK